MISPLVFLLGASLAILPCPATGQRFEDVCSDCEYNSNGVGYVRVGGSCHLYYECLLYQNRFETRTCLTGLYWNQETLNCAHPDEVECFPSNCPHLRPNSVDFRSFFDNGVLVACPAGFQFDIGSCGCNTRIQVTQRPTGRCPENTRPDPDGRGYLVTVGSVDYYMACPGNLVIDENCQCVYPSIVPTFQPPVPTPFQCNVHLDLRVQNGRLLDFSKNSFWVNATGVELRSDSVEFNGNGKILIPGLSNMGASTLRIRIRYERTPGGFNYNALVSNGDCNENAGITICSKGDRVMAELLADNMVTSRLEVPDSSGQQEVVFTVQPGSTELVNQRFADRREIGGTIRNSHNGFVIGQGRPCEGFVGRIYSIEVWRCIP